ncbi:DNA polymerase III [archaeon]|nr:DNA polymerase III [archaeon]|tara:strand:+ start:1099 stop:2817 length:1719 start_codon:yes stop_codon:yes gene_type:complete
MKNREVAQLLYKIADLLEIQGVDWKPQAYRKAAQNIELLDSDISDLYKQGKLDEIPGVGKGIIKKIEEYLKTGKSPSYQKLKKKIPVDVETLMKLQGLGPKKIKLLYNKLKIKNITELEKAAKENRIQALNGMGEKTEKDIIENIERYRQSKGRLLLGYAMPITNKIVSMIEKLKNVSKVEVVGSFRRGKESIGDIDILVVSKKNDKESLMKIMDYFANMSSVEKVLAKGPKRTRVVLEDGIEVDLAIFDSTVFGTAMIFFTGCKNHNIELRTLAINKKMKLNEYGLFKGKKIIAGKTEREVYKKLGMQFIPPELREAHGEMEAAKNNKIPKLIELNDIKGDFHIHSTYSDGSNKIKEMALAAKQLGHKYIAITDHSGRLKIANAMTTKDIKKQWKEIDKLNKTLKGIKILKGVEVNILSNGALDIHRKLFSGFDIVLLSIHAGFKMSSREQTNRILNAISMGYGNILSHPTGRIIGKRPEISFDMKQVLETCKERNIAVELNCYPNRLDLKDIYLKKAVDIGCKIALGTDAHGTDALSFMDIGVKMARRGWVTPKDVVNTMALSELKKWLK